MAPTICRRKVELVAGLMELARRETGDADESILFGLYQRFPGIEQPFVVTPYRFVSGRVDPRHTLIGTLPIVRQHLFPQRRKLRIAGMAVQGT